MFKPFEPFPAHLRIILGFFGSSGIQEINRLLLNAYFLPLQGWLSKNSLNHHSLCLSHELDLAWVEFPKESHLDIFTSIFPWDSKWSDTSLQSRRWWSLYFWPEAVRRTKKHLRGQRKEQERTLNYSQVWGWRSMGGWGQSVLTGTHRTSRIAFAVSYGKCEMIIIFHPVYFSQTQKRMQRKQPEDLWYSGKDLRASLPCHISEPWKDQDLFYPILLAPMNDFVVGGNIFKAKVLAAFPTLLWIYMESKLRKRAFITK